MRIPSFMKPRFFKLFGLICSIIILSCCTQKTEPLRIATAANMQFAMKKLVEEFEELHQIETEIILSSSGKLTAQIEAGAPFDLFFSADTKYPERLASLGLCDNPIIYAYGQLAYWENTERANQVYAMANPKTAPYGQATQEYLSHLAGPRKEMVYGESISQVNQFLLSGAVDGGYTSLSSVLSNRLADEGKWVLIPDSLHSKIAQALVIVGSSKKTNDAQSFVDFVQSKRGQEILKQNGYK